MSIDRLARIRDAQILLDAFKDTEPGTERHEFLMRIRRSFREWGSLTTAMRASLTASSSSA
jgi:hypothetical protein